MKSSDLRRFNNTQVIVILRDGSKRLGRLHTTPEEGLFHVTRDPARSGEIVGGFLEDLYAEDIVEVRPLR